MGQDYAEMETKYLIVLYVKSSLNLNGNISSDVLERSTISI